MHTLRVLEFDSVRARLVETCETELGVAGATEIEPSFNADEVWRLIGLTGEALGLLGTAGLPSLAPVKDLRSAVSRAGKGGALDGMNLYRVGAALAAMRAMRGVLEGRREAAPDIWRIAESLPVLKQIEEKILSSVDSGGDVISGASAELDRLRKFKTQTSQRLLERIQSYTTGRSRELLSDPIYTQREGRYVVPLKAEHRGRIKGIVHDTSGTGQTLFIEPEDVLQLGNALREAEAAEKSEVARVLANLSSRLGLEEDAVVTGIESAGVLDLILAKARLGTQMGGSLPERAKPDAALLLRDARHPLIDPADVVPLSLELGVDFDGLLITGPNTGGKTVAIKTVGLAVLMAQCGMMPPAKVMRFGAFSQVWADIGDEQSLQQSLSTFSGHIRNIAGAFQGLKPGALVLFDEIGAGTDPTEGAALAQAILLELQKKGAKVMASTHYGELKMFAYNTPRFINAAMEFDLKSLRPTYRLMVGVPGASHALRIAERYGLPKSVVEAAREGLGTEQQDVARMLEKLETAQRQAQRAQSESDKLAARLREVDKEAERKLSEAEESRRTARARAADVLESALREIRLEAAKVFDQVKGYVPPKEMEKARQELRELQTVGAELIEELKPPTKKPQISQAILKGATVRVQGYNQVGTVLDEPRNGKAHIQVGGLKMTLPVAGLELVTEPPKKEKAKAKSSIGLAKAQTISRELHLRELRAEEAKRELEKFLDDAVLAGLDRVRIVHGKGEGILREMTWSVLRRYPGIRSYDYGEPAEGGMGVTIAIFD